VLLREAYEAGHEPKLAAAAKHIPRDVLYVSRGAFQRGAFQAGISTSALELTWRPASEPFTSSGMPADGATGSVRTEKRSFATSTRWSTPSKLLGLAGATDRAKPPRAHSQRAGARRPQRQRGGGTRTHRLRYHLCATEGRDGRSLA
jgi:hypothetical protein